MKKQIYQKPMLTLVELGTCRVIADSFLQNEVSTNDAYIKDAGGNGGWNNDKSIWDNEW